MLLDSVFSRRSEIPSKESWEIPDPQVPLWTDALVPKLEWRDRNRAPLTATQRRCVVMVMVRHQHQGLNLLAPATHHTAVPSADSYRGPPMCLVHPGHWGCPTTASILVGEAERRARWAIQAMVLFYPGQQQTHTREVSLVGTGPGNKQHVQRSQNRLVPSEGVQGEKEPQMPRVRSGKPCTCRMDPMEFGPRGRALQRGVTERPASSRDRESAVLAIRGT